MSYKVALFDFCETLVDFQTADAFIDYIRNETRSRSMRTKETIRTILDRFYLIRIVDYIFPGHSLNKRLKLLQLRGYTVNELNYWANRYYNNRIKPHFIPFMIDKMMDYKEKGYQIGVVSGGYGLYLHYFVREFGLDYCLSSNIEFEDNICTGKLDGLDCMNDNKVLLLNGLFTCKPNNTIGFSDSKSDIPFLSWVDKGIVISKNKHQNWVDNFKFDEIIWK